MGGRNLSRLQLAVYPPFRPRQDQLYLVLVSSTSLYDPLLHEFRVVAQSPFVPPGGGGGVGVGVGVGLGLGVGLGREGSGVGVGREGSGVAPG